ncbi:hypothetical protein K443DRAFT_100505 [Laccaria amethystina LaAM-08-1]|uniref:Unplaced genomic scaffold K443scaffold_92, whole genome shotgun sequence n=1 Tax=Laccaria amethystina LaAM-08-1 TaxID=1095629 RepID=A0A0C9XRN4_9AGAR|nr:hypothetical protein K443DRAFT_100505 [Laccaria amethystina LaAM-08-1]
MAPWPFILVGTHGRLSMEVMGPCGRSSILAVSTVDISGPHHSPSFLVVASWPIVDGCGGHLLCFVVVVRREG